MWQRVAVLAGRKAVRNGKLFADHVGPAIVKPARTLWNEVIGFLFFSFAVPFGFKAVHYAIAGDNVRLAFAGFCTLLMGWLGLHSFLRARKISRS